MAKKVTTKKTRSVNNRSNALNATKRKQKLNLQNTIINGEKVRTTVRENKANKKASKQEK